MKVPCSVIQDLLPLYHDNVCSPESCAMIEEHLKDCEACQEEFHRLEESPLPQAVKVKDTEREKVKRIKKVRMVLRKKRVRIAVITAVVVLILCIPAWFAMNLRFLSAKPDVLENISIEGDILNVTLKDSVWRYFFSTDTGYLEENGEQIPIMIISSSISPSQFLGEKVSPKKDNESYKHVSLNMEDNYKLLFLSMGAYYQACQELGYEFGAYPDENASLEVQERADEIMADWEPAPGEGFQRIYFYDGCTVQDLYNLSIDWDDMMANLDKHGTLLWTAEDGVVYP